MASLGPASPKYWHFLVEAKKLAYADLYAFNADADFVRVPVDRLLSRSHASALCGKVDPASLDARLRRLGDRPGNRLVVLVNWAWNYFTWDRGSRVILDDGALTPIGDGQA